MKITDVRDDAPKDHSVRTAAAPGRIRVFDREGGGRIIH